MDDFEEMWASEDFQSSYCAWRDQRVRFASDLASEANAFMTGAIGAKELRELSTGWNGSGFLGNGKIHLDQLVKWVEPSELNSTLRVILDPPDGDPEVVAKLERLHELIDGVLLSGRGIEPSRVLVDGFSVPVGLPDLSTRRVAFFASFFWGAGNPDGWPIMFPSGRDMLIERGLLESGQSQPELYLYFSGLVGRIKGQMGIDSWAAEFLLWKLSRSDS